MVPVRRSRGPRIFAPLARPLAAALLLLVFASLEGCLPGAPRRPDEGRARGPGSSASDPILLSRFDDEVRFVQSQGCAGGGHAVVGDDVPLYSGERRCFLDRIEGSCGMSSRAWYFMVCE